MKIIAKEKLFWFFKKGKKIDLSKPELRDIYIQQILTCGRINDIRALFKKVDFAQFKQSFLRIKRFLPREVKMFWEDYIGSYQ